MKTIKGHATFTPNDGGIPIDLGVVELTELTSTDSTCDAPKAAQFCGVMGWLVLMSGIFWFTWTILNLNPSGVFIGIVVGVSSALWFAIERALTVQAKIEHNTRRGEKSQ